MTFTSHPDRDDSKHSEQSSMQEDAPEGASGTTLAGSVPFASSTPTTVSVSSDSHAVRFLTGNELRQLEQDSVLNARDIWGKER